MKKHKIREEFYDIVTIFLLRMKLIGKDTTTRVILFSSLLLFSVMVFSLSISARDQSALPIGVVDYDMSSTSIELIANLKEVPSLKVYENSEKELLKLLSDEMIISVFVIKKGYDQKLRIGDLKGIITTNFMKNNRAASIISDIVAGEMMYSICYYKGLRLYEQISFEGKKLTAPKYEEYMNHLLENSKDFDFAFDMNYVNPGKSEVQEEAVANTVLYRQLIIGILGILMAFIAMFILSGPVGEKELGVAGRLKLSRLHSLTQDSGNFLALMLVEGLISLIFSILVFTQMQSKDFFLWASIYHLLLLNALVLGGIFILVSKIIKSMILYQLLCSALILFSGGVGFYHLLTGFYQSAANDMINFIPNSWFIQGFTDIIVYGSVGGYMKEGHRILLLMSGVVIALIVILNLLKWLTTNRFRINDKNRMVN